MIKSLPMSFFQLFSLVFASAVLIVSQAKAEEHPSEQLSVTESKTRVYSLSEGTVAEGLTNSYDDEDDDSDEDEQW